jgi:hypothetical protein
MNTQAWITHFERNTHLNDEMELPMGACSLPESVRTPLVTSIATFQLGESGTGSRLRRYAREVAPLENFRGYQRAIDLFVAEEQSHSRLLARTVEHLRGTLLTKQWTNSIFRRLRFLVNLEFAIQVLLTAELIAEVFFGTLYLRCEDPVVRKVSHKLLRDEMKHLNFQRDFLSERVATFNPLGRWALEGPVSGHPRHHLHGRGLGSSPHLSGPRRQARGLPAALFTGLETLPGTSGRGTG